ncbi:choice-of-anchor F family protein [Rubrimonas cliftonensis]|uniref:choice-of-anchor F family protein n=1 Tax=Rubrimonas cliftonensis TaxID=89524 RepID=UPI001587CE10|nr:choice-of-anchor F family protein [Rubrimonas cliftonensis]
MSGAVLAGLAPSAFAATIIGWNTANVAVAPTPADYVTATSVVFDRDAGDPAASPTGAIAFTPPEAASPGIKVVNGAFELGGPGPQPSIAGCIMASSSATCDSPFQSGKRFKEIVTGKAPVDLVFDLGPDSPSFENVGYEVYHRLVNDTGVALRGFTIELGFGVGSGFVASSAGDGLGFSTGFTAGPDDLNAFSQFPFGLFGDADGNPNFTLDGFFAAERTGFDLLFSEDILSSQGFYGPYADLFGPWMTRDVVPDGAFWDFDSDPLTDDLLMAWQREDSVWELRRDIVNGVAVSLAVAEEFASLADVIARLGVQLGDGPIEDLANLNATYAIALADSFSGDDFTLRVTVAPVPLPGAAPLLIAALAVFGLAARRRAAA